MMVTLMVESLPLELDRLLPADDGLSAAVILQLEQRWLLRARMGFLLLAAKFQHLAPEMALAVDLDELESDHDRQPSSPAR
jgi:hypothetical protein